MSINKYIEKWDKECELESNDPDYLFDTGGLFDETVNYALEVESAMIGLLDLVDSKLSIFTNEQLELLNKARAIKSKISRD